MKRIISILLVMVITFTFSVSVLAADTENDNADITATDTVKVEAFRLQNENGPGTIYDRKCVFVFTYGSEYSVKGENPRVFLDIYKDAQREQLKYSIEVSESSISQEIYKYDNVNYPQVFISVPESGGITVIRVEKGAFLTENGEKSCKVEVLYSDYIGLTSGNFKLKCKAEASVKSEKFIYVILKGSKVEVTPVINSDYADIWLSNSKINYYLEDKLLELEGNSISPDKIGKYKVEFVLNDQFKAHKHFDTTNAVRRYFEVLGLSAFAFLISPFTLVLGAIVALIPGIGTVFGVDMVMSSILSILNLFLSVFGINMGRELNF